MGSQMLEELLSQHLIDVSNIEVTGCFYHLNHSYEMSKTIEGVYHVKPQACPYCSNNNIEMFQLYKYQTVKIKLKSKPILPTTLLLKKPAFKCLLCHRNFNSQVDFVDKNCNISNDLKEYIFELLQVRPKLSYKKISMKTHVSENRIAYLNKILKKRDIIENNSQISDCDIS